jgi:hypothetical protein
MRQMWGYTKSGRFSRKNSAGRDPVPARKRLQAGLDKLNPAAGKTICAEQETTEKTRAKTKAQRPEQGQKQGQRKTKTGRSAQSQGVAGYRAVTECIMLLEMYWASFHLPGKEKSRHAELLCLLAC